jgi:hypothetical protein
MKVQYKSKNGRMTFEINSDTEKGVFSELARIQDLFEENTCGLCKSTDTRFLVRTVDDDNYYEMKCQACGAAVSYGQNKKGDTLYVKRKNDEGRYDAKNGGWAKYDPVKAQAAKEALEAKKAEEKAAKRSGR